MKLLSIVLACLCMQTASAQNFPNIYRDVMALQKTINGTVFKTDSASQEIYLPILLKYFAPGESRSLNQTKELIEKSGNPFGISDMLKNMKLVTIPPGGLLTEKNKQLMRGEEPLPAAPSAAASAAESVAGSTPGLNAPLLASAITSLVIKRAKEELTVAFFNKFRKDLNNDAAGLKVLFPKTTELINNIETYLYASFLNTLRAAFAEDIAALVTTVPAHLRSADISRRILNDPSRYKLWLSIPVLDALGSLFAGGSLADAVQKLQPKQPIIQKSEEKNIYNTLELLYTLSESVRDETELTNWISTTSFSDKIISDPVSTRLFYGLLYEKIRSISFTKADGTELKLTAVITNTQQKIDALNNTVKFFLQGFNQAAAELGTLQTMGKPFNDSSFQNTIAFINKISNAVKKNCIQINRLMELGDDMQEEKINALFNKVSKLTELAGNLYKKEYSAAVLHAAILINHYLPDTSRAARAQLIKYGSLAVSIVESKNAEDIGAALDAAILPTGSSSIKQHTGWSVSINSYIGVNLYKEKYKNIAVKNEKTSFGTFGISLPVGVAFTKGLRSKWVGSLSLFTSILDLGAVASYQLSTPDSVTSKQLPDFTWKNLLAPGGFIVLGRLFNTPLSIGFGAQKGPTLRNISYTAGGTTVDLSDKLSWRTGVFLAVDIPFFNLYSRPYAKSTQQ